MAAQVIHPFCPVPAEHVGYFTLLPYRLLYRTVVSYDVHGASR